MSTYPRSFDFFWREQWLRQGFSQQLHGLLQGASQPIHLVHDHFAIAAHMRCQAMSLKVSVGSGTNV